MRPIIEGEYTLTKGHSATDNTHTHYAQRTDQAQTFLVAQSQISEQLQGLQPFTSLRHQNLCPLVAIEEGLVVSEVEGEPVEELVERLGKEVRLPMGIALRIAAEVSVGLAFLHNNDLLHLHLHTNGIFCSNKGEVRVYGAGITAACYKLDALRQQRVKMSVFRDFSYSSPDMIKGQADNRADIFSLGGVLCWMISQHKPFGEELSFKTLINVMKNSREPLQPIEGDPPGLYALINHALQPALEDRPQRAEDMEQTLRQLLAPLGGSGVRFDLGALVRLFHANWRPPYGPYSGYLLREMVKLNEISWLSPDPELESLTPSALEWLEQRADEHLSALFTLFESAELPPCRIKVTRSLFEAKRLADREAASAHPQAIAWREAVASVLRRTEELSRCHPQWSAAVDALKTETLAVSFPGKKIQRAQQELLSKWWDSTGNPSERTLLAQVAFMMIFADLPSPWAPLCEMWVRGVWPLVFSEEGLLVYVPVLQKGRLVPSPDGAYDDKKLPQFTLPL